VSGLTHNLTHVTQGLDRVLEQWRDSPRVLALLAILLLRTQAAEDVIWDLYTGVWLDNSVGTQLDNLGAIVGEPRMGRQDDDYRIWVRVRIAINRANGRVYDTLFVAQLAAQSDPSPDDVIAVYTPEYPAAYRVDFTSTSIGASVWKAILDQVRPAGVGLVVRVNVDLAHALILDDSGAPFVDGSINGLNTGLLADIA
jgi:hypothetical protein